MLVKKNQNQFIFWITASCLIFMLAVILFTPFSLTHAASGNDAISNLDTVGTTAGLVKKDIRLVIGRVIKIFLDVVGAIFFIIILYAGYVYMTSGGDPIKTKEAKAWMINATIGLIIIFASYAIVSFLFRMWDRTDGDYTISSSIPKGLGYNLSGSAFGEILSGHAPLPEQTEVPRNTMIVVTFKLPIDPTSFIDLSSPSTTTKDANGKVIAFGYDVCPDALAKCKSAADCPTTKSVCGPVNRDAFKTFRCDNMPDWPTTSPLKKPDDCLDAVIADPTSNDDVVPGFIMITQDRRTVVFNPFGNGKTTDDYLGSSEENVSYIVHLVGPPPAGVGIRKQEPAGTSVFSIPSVGRLNGYHWRFTTGTFVDLTPPKVLNTIPADTVGIEGANPVVIDGSLDKSSPTRKVFRNQIVVANFNEPVLPLFSTDQESCTSENNFNEAQLLLADGTKVTKDVGGDCATSHVPGKWITGLNQYRTIQFISSLECQGVEENSCGEKPFCLPANKDMAGLLQAAKVTEEMAEIGTGIVDLAGNSLDGHINADGTTNGKADGQPADDFNWSFGVGNTIDLIPPAIQELTPRNNTSSVEKSVHIIATFNKDLEAATVDTNIFLYGEDFSGWFDPNLPVTSPLPASGLSMNIMDMTHGPFTEVTTGTEGPLYMPVIKSKVRDTRQNCFTSSRNFVPEDEDGEPLFGPYELTSPITTPESTTTDCNDLADNEYGKSCCPNIDHKPTLQPLGGECVEPWTIVPAVTE